LNKNEKKLYVQSRNKLFDEEYNIEEKNLKNRNTKPLQQAKSITESLERTKRIISENSDRMISSMDVLGKNRESINNFVNTKTNTLEDLEKTRKLLRDIKWNEKKNIYYKYLSFLFFILVVIYVINKRIPFITLFFFILNKIKNIFI
jgi:hypothetical protein